MFGLDPGGVTLGMGLFAFSKDGLPRWRAGVDGGHLDTVFDGLAGTDARFNEPELKKVPAPYPADHPQAAHLRRKGVTVWRDGLAAETGFGADGPARCADALTGTFDFYHALRDVLRG